MRFRRVSMTMIGAATLLLALEVPEAGAQRGRLGILRPTPRPNRFAGAPRPRAATISGHLFTSCVAGSVAFAPFAFNPFLFGGLPFVNVQLFTGSQPAPDPSSQLVPNPGAQPVPFPGSHPAPGVHAVPQLQPVPAFQNAPGGFVTSAGGSSFAAPVYGAPVYAAPVYAGATPMATPRVSDGMVIGDVFPDPSFGFGFFGGGGVVCLPTRALGSVIIVR